MSQSSQRSDTKFAFKWQGHHSANRKSLQLFNSAPTFSNINFNGFQMNRRTKAEGSQVHDIIFFKFMISFFSEHAIRVPGHTLRPCALGCQDSKRELDDDFTCELLTVERRSTFHSKRKVWLCFKYCRR